MSKIPLRRRRPQPSKLPCKVRSAHVDWITCTATRSGSGEALWRVGDTLLRQDQGVGEDVTPWQLHGYRGWSTGSVKLACRGESVLVSCSSSKCSQHWEECFSAAENCSRLDLAVDVDLDQVTLHLARDLYENVHRLPPLNGRPVKSTLIQNSDGGSTLYIGSRQSDLFARAYDKGVEQATHGPGRWYRFELEVKGDRALTVARTLHSAVAYPPQLLSMVARYFEERAGIRLPYKSSVAVCNGEPHHTSIDQQLHWLSSQVRPTVKRLLERNMRREVLEALHLQSAVPEEL